MIRNTLTCLVAAIVVNILLGAGVSSAAIPSPMPADGAFVRVCDGRMTFDGLRDVAYDQKLFAIKDGPFADEGGFEPLEPDASIAGNLEFTLAQRGTVMFWLRTDQEYSGGLDVEKSSRQILTAPGLFDLAMDQGGDSVRFFWKWAGEPDEMIMHHMHVIMPSIPGPGWIHLAYVWDTDKGYFNCYLNGTPYRTPGMESPAFDVGQADRLVITPGQFRLSDVYASDKVIDVDLIDDIVGPSHRGYLDAVLGAAELGGIDPDAFKGKLLYENALAGAADVADWRAEGPAIIEFDDGWMTMSSHQSEGDPISGHIVHWCDKTFPASFVAQWDVQILSEYGLNIVFFAARGLDGSHMFDPDLAEREGLFRQYILGDTQSYHISYYASTPGEARRMANVRKNPGIYLVSNGPVGIPHDDKDAHTLTLIKNGGRIMMAVDGRKFIDFVDHGQKYGPVLPSGCIGLRQMKWSKCRYRNFRVHEYKSPEVPVRVTNPGGFARQNEPVVVDADALAGWFTNEQLEFVKVVDAAGAEVAAQVDDLDGDGVYDEIAFLSDFASGQERTFRITSDESCGPANTRYVPQVNAQMARKVGDDIESKDEIKVPGGDLWLDAEHHGPAWESELIAYRIYFDKKSATDIYGKLTPRIELNRSRWYTVDELLATGYGHDILFVGESLGLGSVRGWDGQNDIMLDPVRSRDARMVADGPVRSIVEMKAVGWEVAGRQVDLTSRFTMYAHRRDMIHDVVVEPAGAVTLCTGMVTMLDAQFAADADAGVFTQWGYSTPNVNKPDERELIGMAIVTLDGQITQVDATDNSHILVFADGQDHYSFRIAAAWDGEAEPFGSQQQFLEYAETLRRASVAELMIEVAQP